MVIFLLTVNNHIVNLDLDVPSNMLLEHLINKAMVGGSSIF